MQNYALSAVPTCNSSSKWEIAADNWINATPGGSNPIEVMVWEYNCNQIPAGSFTGRTLTIDGQTFDLWVKTGSDPTYSLVSTSNRTSGAIHDLDIFNWLESSQGGDYFSNSLPLAQLNMGEEIVSTGSAEVTWTYTESYNSIEVG